jgi:hypothetical protein
MLVTFSCKAHADITMFGEVAVQLLKLMGHSGTVPSALSADDVPAALEHLKAGVESGKAAAAEEADDDPDSDRVSLGVRAVPLIALLEDAKKANCPVMWDS